MKLTVTILLFIHSISVIAQKNCEVFNMNGDTCKYEACKYLESAPRYFQLRKEFHDIYDEAITICPEYSDTYRAKSVAYLKTGDFITWKQLMDKAVDLSPKEHLGYRGWCRFQFFRDYEGAISDIEYLETLEPFDIGYSQNGMYHLQVAKALCYKQLGAKDVALELLSDHLAKYEGGANTYDYLHLGVLYLEMDQPELAKQAFGQQSGIYNCAENNYYLAMAYKQLGEQEKSLPHLQEAKNLYEESLVMYDTYTHQVDKIFRSDIEEAIRNK